MALVGLAADFQYSQATRVNWTIQDLVEHRDYPSGLGHIAVAGAAWQAAGVDFVAHLGDILDNSSNDPATHMASMINALETTGGYTGEHYHVLGNHEKTLKTSEGDWTWYTDTIDNSTAPNYEAIWNDDGIDKAYSFDINGIHYVVIYALIADVGNDQRAALAAHLGTVASPTMNLPVVVLSHAHLHPGCGYGYGFSGSVSDCALTRGVLEDCGLVQAVFEGHFHNNKCSTVINEIPYFTLRGAVLANDLDDNSHNSYYIADIRPFAVTGNIQRIANIEITGFGRGSSKAFDQYII